MTVVHRQENLNARAAAREIEIAKDIQRERLESLSEELKGMQPATVIANQQVDAPSSMFQMISKGESANLEDLLDTSPELLHAKIQLGWGPYSIGYGVMRYHLCRNRMGRWGGVIATCT